MEPYSRIGLLRSYSNLQSYWTATKLRKLTLVLDYYYSILFKIMTSGTLTSSYENTTVSLPKINGNEVVNLLEYYVKLCRFFKAELHSKRVRKMSNYTPNEWRRCQTTLETSGQDEKLHPKRVGKITRSQWILP